MIDYPARKAYRDQEVALTYDLERFSGIKGMLEDHLEKKALEKALRLVQPTKEVLDLPCGTGRITSFLSTKVGSLFAGDISMEMLRVAKGKTEKSPPSVIYSQCSAENLPFRDGAFDIIVSMRFFGHLPPGAKIEVLREMRRVTRRSLIIGFAERNTIRGLYRRRIKKIPLWFQVSETELKNELAKVGMVIRQTFPILGWFSETKIYLIDVSRDALGSRAHDGRDAERTGK